MERIREVLVWGPRRIGSVVTTFPALKLLRAHLPRAKVTYVTTDYAEEAVRFSGLVDEVWTLERKGFFANLSKYHGLRKKVEAGGFDRIFVLGNSKNYVRRIGSLSETACADDQTFGHRSERRARAILVGLGIRENAIPSHRLEIPDQPETGGKMASLGIRMGSDAYWVIHPGCGIGGTEPQNAWPADRYRTVIQRVQERFPELKAVLVGTEKERSWVEARIAGPLAQARVVDLCGRTRIAELLQLLKHARLLLCGDSGVMHLGTVTETPMVALFGRTNEDICGPFAMGDKATILRGLPRREAMRHPDPLGGISPERVFQELQRRLAAPTTGPSRGV